MSISNRPRPRPRPRRRSLGRLVIEAEEERAWKRELAVRSFARVRLFELLRGPAPRAFVGRHRAIGYFYDRVA